MGTGKTTIIRSYLQKIDRKQILPIFIFNSRISFVELLQTFLHEIGVAAEVIRKYRQINDMVRLTYQVMLNLNGKGKNIVLIIDEAQNMPVETLSNLCVLSNFETAKAKLIQIILVGQPELQEKLDRFELRQLRQRIAYKAQITSLSKKESRKYLQHRLALSAVKQAPVFTAGAIRHIVKHSNGVPRVINILSENALVAGFGSNKKPVSSRLVKQVVAEYKGKTIPVSGLLRNVAIGVVILLPVVILVASTGDFISNKAEKIPVRIDVLSKSHAQQGQRAVTVNSPIVQTAPQGNAAELALARSVKSMRQSRTIETPTSSVHTTKPRFYKYIKSNFLPGGFGDTPVDISVDEAIKHPKSDDIFPISSKNQVTTGKEASSLKIVKKGDTVSGLCLATYGFYNKQVLLWIKKHNPQIVNLDEISVGGVVILPALVPSHFLHASALSREEVMSR